MEPIARIEIFLAVIAGESYELPVPQTRVELFLANIAGESYELPAPEARVELYLAKILGQNVTLPVPQSRIDRYLAAIAGEAVDPPEYWTTRVEYWLAKWAEGTGGQIVTVTGVAPLLLQRALAKQIQSLTQYGLCTQSTTPTPSAPVDIMCNNGALRYGAVGKNLVNITAADIEQGAISSADGSNSGSASHRVRTIGYYPVKPNTQYTISCVIDGYTSGSSKGVFILEYSSDSVSGYTGDSSGWKSPDGYTFTTGATTNFIRIVFAKGASTSTPTIPEDVTNVQLEYGDTATAYEPFVGGIVADGTPEVLTVSASGAETQTVTDVPMLLSVGDYEDEKDIISGIKTGKVGIKVLMGEDIVSFNNGCFFVNINDKAGGKGTTLSTHFTYSTGTSVSIAVGQMGAASGTSKSTFYKVDGVTSKAEAQDWLAAQYAAGTPVIVVYPLAESTTEQTTPHALHTTEGDNIVDVAANVSPVELAAEFTQASA